MGKESSTYRIVHMLKELNDGKMLCIEALAGAFDTSTRSIRRDLELIREIFGDILVRPQKGCYRAVQKTVLDDTLNSTELYLLKNILKLSRRADLAVTKAVDTAVTDAVVKDETDSPYLFKSKPYEEIYCHKALFRTLEHAVRYHKEIALIYSNADRVNRFTLKPYKLLFLNENFYLACEYKNRKFMLLRIAMVQEVSLTGKTFQHDFEIMEFIHWMQSPWATFRPYYKNHLIEAVVEVPKAQAKYFKLKKFMPSQRIVKEEEDGTLQLAFTVSSQNELFALIKQWIPYMRVISPPSLKAYFQGVAERFLQSVEGETDFDV